ncbi:MAG: class I SAM-dependent methyltransferase [Candidatus Omnitrophica bacterium]|nr:class I SAM-dependent methyltransferase [Candidatus Omnitrophota bacterium]MDD5081193.1 class I SAM-dependent methyltransferase [Candidatus Omnitrophota bacterium]MDD5440631.1 class I SAM-dependent methyltransferase [Candidatus Omnitrophota bacterium]
MNSKDILKEYNEKADKYKALGYDVEKERKYFLNKILPLSGKILEVGTGRGNLTLELARNGYSFITIDIQKNVQLKAKEYLKFFKLEKHVAFLIEDVCNLSFTDDSFDVIVSLNTLHHLTEPFKAADELIRVLETKGRIAISEFNEKGFKIIDEMHSARGEKHDIQGISLNNFFMYLKEKNFSIKKYKGKFQDIFIAER